MKKIKLPKAVAKFLKDHGEHLNIETGTYFKLPFWYRETEDKTIFEEMRVPDGCMEESPKKKLPNLKISLPIIRCVDEFIATRDAIKERLAEMGTFSGHALNSYLNNKHFYWVALF